MRLSYVIWQEQVAPYLVVELLSPGIEREDLGKAGRDTDEPPTKWTVYEQILQIPYYVVFSRYTDNVRFFVLNNYQYGEIHPADQRLWLSEAGLGLGLWSGSYQGIERKWLRFCDAHGVWLPTQGEQTERERQDREQERQRAEQEQQRAEQERQRAEQTEQRAERLAAQLKALGIEPES